MGESHIESPADATVINIALTGDETANSFEIKTLSATTINVTGDLGSGKDTVVLSIVDTDATSQQIRELTVDTSSLSSSGDTLHFLFESSADIHNDTIVLSADSKITSAVSSISVSHGTLDLTSADIAPGLSLIHI